MPIFAYQCAEGHQEEGYVPSHLSPLPACSHCGGQTEKIWKITRHVAASVFPYVTTNITPDGSPVEVTSQSHLDQLCKQFGVVHRPDVAWIEEEHQGVDFRTGEQRYKKGNGVGMPGCWV